MFNEDINILQNIQKIILIYEDKKPTLLDISNIDVFKNNVLNLLHIDEQNKLVYRNNLGDKCHHFNSYRKSLIQIINNHKEYYSNKYIKLKNSPN
jgi:hypothetical protein